MKKFCCLILSVFVLITVLGGCQTNKNQVPTINTRNTEMLKEKYITPIVKSGVYGNWENPTDDILPIDFLDFYFYSGNLDYDKIEISMYGHHSYYFNQDKVENFVMKYFNDVTPEYIRKADDYRKDKNAYIFGGINGGEIPTKITGANQQDDILTINYEILDIHGETYYICETKIKLIDKDNYKYISCSRIDEWKKTNEVRGMSND